MRLATFAVVALNAVVMTAPGCHERADTSDDIQRKQQETILREGTSSVGMPAVKNFRERRLLKDILELRDQANVSTYTYLQSSVSGRLVYLCDSIGYGIPYATQFTNPQKVEQYITPGGHYAWVAIPQADPSGLFSPSAADGTWVMCKDPNGADVKPVFIEPRIVVSPFRMPAAEERIGLKPLAFV